jgi:hypothetical protein
LWCPVCRTHHLHPYQVKGKPTRAEHRVAHCAGGPFFDGGYMIQPAPKCDPAWAAHAVKPACWWPERRVVAKRKLRRRR